MLRLLALWLVAVAMGQIFLPGGRLTLDRVDGFTVDAQCRYRTLQNIILLVSDRECYIVEAPDAAWDTLVRNHDQLHSVALAIIRQIEVNTGVIVTQPPFSQHEVKMTHITFREAAQDYHSRLEELQCILKQIYLVQYTPIPTTTGSD